MDLLVVLLRYVFGDCQRRLQLTLNSQLKWALKMEVTARYEATSRNDKLLIFNILQDCFVPRKDPPLVVLL
jgi:hypothetical protein